MHGFVRGPVPAELTAWLRDKRAENDRELANVAWDELDAGTKNAIKRALLLAQGFLCAYCGGRIEAATMRIEHFEPQHRAPSLRFAWDNLFGVCEGFFGRERHCDNHRGTLTPEAQALSLKPDRDRLRIRQILAYRRGEGGILVSSEDGAAHRDVDVTLNLNARTLRSNREHALKQVRARLGKKDGPVAARTLAGLSVPNASGRLEAYLPSLLPYLDRKARNAR